MTPSQHQHFHISGISHPYNKQEDVDSQLVFTNKIKSIELYPWRIRSSDLTKNDTTCLILSLTEGASINNLILMTKWV